MTAPTAEIHRPSLMLTGDVDDMTLLSDGLDIRIRSL
jgi:hypothetical protein